MCAEWSNDHYIYIHVLNDMNLDTSTEYKYIINHIRRVEQKVHERVFLCEDLWYSRNSLGRRFFLRWSTAFLPMISGC